jgi:hypothetical protein
LFRPCLHESGYSAATKNFQHASTIKFHAMDPHPSQL